MEKCGRATWIAGTFITPKKDGQVHWVSDFQGLNKTLKQKYCPLPKIQEIFSRCKGYKFILKLALSMQCYTFKLDDKSKDLCTIATPWGLLGHICSPMGVSPAPDIAQDVMECVSASLIEEIEVCLDNIAAFLDKWESHLVLLEKLLTLLQEKGFSINPAKCKLGIQEANFLDIDLCQKVSSPGARRLMPSYIWNLPLTSRNFILFSEWLRITEICGLIILTFLHLSHLALLKVKEF